MTAYIPLGKKVDAGERKYYNDKFQSKKYIKGFGSFDTLRYNTEYLERKKN